MFPQDDIPRTTVQFAPLASKLIKEGCTLVISLRSDGNVSIAQQVEVTSGIKKMHIYLKNAIEVQPHTLYDIRDAIDQAISVLFQSSS